MDYSLHFAIVVSTIFGSNGLSHDDCWIPCDDFQHGSCVSILCKTDSRATYECHLISTVMSSYLVRKPLKTCITPHEVPGMAHFCSNLLYNGSLLLENLRIDTNPKTVKPVHEDEEVKVARGPECIPLTILAGVAVGCFTTGCVVTWLFLLILWSRNTLMCGEENSKEGNLTEGDRQQPINPIVRNEVVPARMMSLSHQRLLSSTSIDSGMSSSQAVSTVVPSVGSVLTAPPIHDTCTTQHADTETVHDYTRLNRESIASVTVQELEHTHSNNDYASLVTADILGMQRNVNSGNPYLTLQSPNSSQQDQSPMLPQSRDSCPAVEYPSVSRSIKSDTHDYDSIFSDSTVNADDIDYADCGNRQGDDGDTNDYHECEASNSLERHEYFVLQEYPHEYFIMQKE